MTLIELILNAGSIAGLFTIFLEIHQSRRNRPSFTFTKEGDHTKEFERDGVLWWNYYVNGIIRNASLNPNSIARLHLVIWKDGKITQTLRHSHGVKSIKNLATDDALSVPLTMEARSAKRVGLTFEIRLTNKDGSPSGDGQLMLEMVPVSPQHPDFVVHKHNYETLFEDAAGNYFDCSGRLLSRKLMDLSLTLQNHKRRKRFDHYNKIASAWVEWKLAILRSYFGFYR
jgi:hypothetical protein